MSALERRLAALVADEEHARRRLNLVEAAHEALANGTARPDQMHLVVGKQAQRELKQWIPTLVLTSARRARGLASGKSRSELWMRYLPGQVLSYRPDEGLPRTLAKKVARLDEALQGPADDLVIRRHAAVARMIIGPGEGEQRRAGLWDGRCEAQARKRSCDPERWWDANLLRDWSEVFDFLSRRADPVVDFDTAAHKWVMSYEGFASAIQEMQEVTR